MSNRRISVYDVTGLRVHPDGRRVDRTANKPRSRYWAPGATQDDQGNWIAVDAAGSFHVPRYTKRKRPGTENEEEQEEDAFEGLDEDESDDGYRKETTPTRGGKEGDKGKGKMKERVGKDKGPQYRQRFKEDESYLGAGQSRSESVPPDIPSQELLKAIHHFTANHYAENGFLHNSSKKYRIRRKKRREAKRAAERKAQGIDIEAAMSKGAAAEDEDDSGSGSDSDDRGDKEGGSSDSDNLSPPPIDPPEPGSSKIRGPGRPKRSKQYRDMYRVFDGSALMAIGILCQEYVRHLVEAPTTAHEYEHQEEILTPRRKRSKKGRHTKPSRIDDTNENILSNGEGPSKASHADNDETQSNEEVLPNLGPSSWTPNTYPINPPP
ncbi:hypothetical protein FA13DRAFT_1813597 [Coprinellus micaceus]|uniref:Uncharacterized protein n=1 Tax=Coprinellus micaceus TaxID=71717 RepID=A0A4Y7TDL1_COPMI|nr:hypothetical protein FA13DRAFT_1813597 [Coprinellus micaceus]